MADHCGLIFIISKTSNLGLNKYISIVNDPNETFVYCLNFILQWKISTYFNILVSINY